MDIVFTLFLDLLYVSYVNEPGNKLPDASRFSTPFQKNTTFFIHKTNKSL